MRGMGRRDVGFDLENVVVLEHTEGHCLKPAVKSKQSWCSAGYFVSEDRDKTMWTAWVARHGRVLSNPHMITSFYSTTGRWRSNMKSVRPSLAIHLCLY